MIVGGQTEARAQLSSTIIDYHEPFDQGLRNVRIRLHVQYDGEWSVRSYNNCVMKSGTTEYYYVCYTVV